MLAIGISVIFSIIFSLKVLFNIWWKQECDSPLNEIFSETEDIPAYVLWGELYVGDSAVNIREICNEKGYILEEVLCVKDGNIYFVCDVPFEENWCLAIGIVNLVTLDFQIKYKEPELFLGKSYCPTYAKDYKEKNGYYYNGKIVLNNQKDVVVYSVDSGEIQRYEYIEYEFPERFVYGKCIDNHTIKLHLGNDVRQYTLEDMAADSKGIAQLYELKDQHTYDGSSYIYDLFASESSVQYIEDKVYIIGRCLNYIGNSGAVILEYDVEEERWIYVVGKNIPLSQNIHMECYVIPQH